MLSFSLLNSRKINNKQRCFFLGYRKRPFLFYGFTLGGFTMKFTGIRKHKRLLSAVLLGMSLISYGSMYSHTEASYKADKIEYLQTKEDGVIDGDYYVASTPENISWGVLPNKNTKMILTVPSGSTVTFDTVSHEGILEDQGQNPTEYFGKYGVSPEHVLQDAKKIAAEKKGHDFDKNGPHVVTGPVFVEGAEPGDVLKVEVLSLMPRVPYGVISNRHFKGVLPEFPENNPRLDNPTPANPERYGNVSVFTPLEKINGEWMGIVKDKADNKITFPINPFLGIMGVTPNDENSWSSVPPARIGGNIDINELGVGATLYLPVEVAGAGFYTGDPHFVQGDGEVALTAMEASLRGTVRLTVLKKGSAEIPATNSESLVQPFAETEKFWIPIGLDEDLDEAMRKSVRESVSFIAKQIGVDRRVAYAYLSAAVDYEVSQAVDKTKGIHALIPKADFISALSFKLSINGKDCPVEMINRNLYVPAETAINAAGGKYKASKNAMTVELADKHISASVNSNVFAINSDSVTSVNAAPVISNEGKIYIPVSSLSEIFGLKVNWATVDHTIEGNASN